jgi:hypothetical protein
MACFLTDVSPHVASQMLLTLLLLLLLLLPLQCVGAAHL